MSTVAAAQALALPVPDRGSALLSLREDQWFDRKSQRSSPQDLANLLIGFANAEGGMVVVGLWNGRVEGVDAAGARLADWQRQGPDDLREHSGN